MKLKSGLVLLLFVFSCALNTRAQEPASAADSLEKLRAQLLEVQTKEEPLLVRAQQLEESLKPENIERSLAGVGSTRPEELREHRRRQLAIERDGVLAQLKLLEASRQRLETAIANAETQAYHQSARATPPSDQVMVVSDISAYRWLLFGGGGFAALALAGGVLLYRRKIRMR